ncbi:glycogen-binding regulatory subunit of S/T protein phosphatase I [Clostridia bacterium]|nr:glycogen-binding regulatory subunit of S/T protein phosphatase I [Clostridia bacterium]
MKFKKLTSAFLVIVMMLALFAIAPSASAVTDQVSLIYAEHYTVSSGGVPPYSFNVGAKGVIEVENLGYSKLVTVHYRFIDSTGAGSSWYDTSASYYQTLVTGKEAWSFTTGTQNSGYRGTVKVEFAIKYEVNGQEYWDNNGGQNYKVFSGGWGEQSYMAIGTAGLKVEPNPSAYSNTLSGAIQLVNYDYSKVVTIRYTTDNWATYNDASATYYSTISGTGLERWTFSVPLPTGTTSVQFAASYTVSGTTYWDNNFGDNYTVNIY